MLPRPRSVLDDPTLFENRLPVPHGHGNNSARYHKRSVREGFEKQKRLEEIEAALRERKMRPSHGKLTTSRTTFETSRPYATS